MALADATQSAEGPDEFGGDGPGVAQRWISEIQLAEKDHAAWQSLCRRIIKIYRGTRPTNEPDAQTTTDRKFSLFWSNMETLGPAILARTPQAVVGRRWKDADPVGRLASEVLERGLNFALDDEAILDVLKGVRTEYLLCGRAVAFVRYVPHIEKVAGHNGGPPLDDDDADPDGQVAAPELTEKVTWEETVFDHISWDDFLHSPARKWAEVRWVCRIAYMTRAELVKRFGETIGKAVPLDHKAGDASSDQGGNDDTQFAKAAVYEIWDKVERVAVWISKSYPDRPLDQREDPLGLKGFFPCPRPVLGTTAPDSLLPIPDWTYYESQLRDIDELTRRIGKLTDAVKLRGFYAAGGEAKEGLKNLMEAETNTMTPIEGWQAFMDQGGVEKLVAWMPLDMVVEALKSCIEARQQLVNDVYQITGIADIMRGDVDPDETATATKTKANWGSLRVRDKQKELARFARELLRIAGEIIAMKFQPQTLAEMSNVQLLPDAAAKQQLQQQLQSMAMQAQMVAQHAQATGGQPPPPFQPPAEMTDMLGKPTWEDVEGLLRNNTLRGFRIDVETDSTIEPNEQEEKQRRVEFVQAVGELVSKMMPMLQLAPALLPMATQTLLWLVRGFRVGREMEDVIEKAMDELQKGAGQSQQQPQGPNPQVEQAKAQAAGMSAQARVMDAQTHQFQAQTERGRAQAQAQNDQAQIAAENARTQAGLHADQAMHGQSLQADMQQAVIKSQERRLIRDINAPLHIEDETR